MSDMMPYDPTAVAVIAAVERHNLKHFLITATMPQAGAQLQAIYGIAVLAMDRGVVAAFSLPELGLGGYP